MTCYQRHLGALFESLDLEYSNDNRARVDAALRELFGLGEEAHCPDVWASIKAHSPDERAALPVRVAGLL